MCSASGISQSSDPAPACAAYVRLSSSPPPPLPARTRRTGRGAIRPTRLLQPLGRAVAAEDCDCDGLDGLERKHEGCCCAACRRLPHRSLARAVRHDGPEARARRRRFEEDLAPHREAEPADPPSLDVGARREERDRSVDIPGGAPAERVRIPFARAVPPHVDREDAVPVPDEHARMRGRASPVGDENDGCAVARWNVRSVKCEAVLRRERDRSCRRPEPRRRRLSSRPVGRDDRCRDGNDEPGDEKHRYQAEPGAAGEPPAVVVAASPEDAKTRAQERQPRRGEQEARRGLRVHVTAGGIGRGDSCSDERPHAQDERRRGDRGRGGTEHHDQREPENHEGDHRRNGVIAPPRSGRRCRGDDDDVESDGRDGRHEDETLPRRRPVHPPSVNERGSSLDVQLGTRIKMKPCAPGTGCTARCFVLSRTNSAAIRAPCVLASHSRIPPRPRSVILIRALTGLAGVVVLERERGTEAEALVLQVVA